MKRRLPKKIGIALLAWLAVDLLGGSILAWRLTRTEPWVRVADPEIHHGFRAMSSQTEQYGPYRGEIFINSLGGKDQACQEVPKVASRPRVVVLGDSFAEGWGLPFEEGVVGQLRQSLASSNVDVLGFGISSHCPTLTERWVNQLMQEGVRWDLAMLLVDPGDSYDEMDILPFLSGKKKAKRKNTPQFLRLRWYEYSLTYQAICRMRKGLIEPSPVSQLSQAIRGNEHKVVWLDRPREAPWFREGLSRSASAICRLHATARQKGFPLLVAIYPYPRMMVQNKLQNDYTEFWKDFAHREGIPLLDLTPLFFDSERGVETVYEENFIPGDFHWNAVGSARVVQALQPWIKENLPTAFPQNANQSSR